MSAGVVDRMVYTVADKPHYFESIRCLGDADKDVILPEVVCASFN